MTQRALQVVNGKGDEEQNKGSILEVWVQFIANGVHSPRQQEDACNLSL